MLTELLHLPFLLMQTGGSGIAMGAVVLGIYLFVIGTAIYGAIKFTIGPVYTDKATISSRDYHPGQHAVYGPADLPIPERWEVQIRLDNGREGSFPVSKGFWDTLRLGDSCIVTYRRGWFGNGIDITGLSVST